MPDYRLATVYTRYLYAVDNNNDTMTGNTENEVFDPARASRIVNGGAGFDALGLGRVDVNINPVRYLVGSPSSEIDLEAGVAVLHDTTDINGTVTNNTFTYTLVSIENAFGSNGADTMRAAAIGSDLDGLRGNDILIGGAGSDVLAGGEGMDTLTGGGGADTFQFRAVYSGPTAKVESKVGGIDSITDFQTGLDRIDLTGINYLSSISIVRTGAGSALFAASSAQPSSDMQTVVGVTGVVQGSDIYFWNTGGVSFQMTGDERDDLLIGSAGVDSLYGLDGDDVLIGGRSGDALYGGVGADTFRYLKASDSTNTALDIIGDFLTGYDTIDLAALNPTEVSILYYNGGSIISGRSDGQPFQIGSVRYVNANDLKGLTAGVYLVGDGDPNTLTGSTLGDSIVGGAGNDTIIGGRAGDALYGGAGADIFKYVSATDSTNAALDILHDFQTGIDKIDLTALNPTNVSILRSNGGSFVSGTATGGAAFQIASIQDVNANDLIGLTGAVYMGGDASDNVLVGGSGNSTEFQGLGNDTIDGGAGNDTLIGGGGADSLIGGAGADTFKYLLVSDSSTLYDGIRDFQTGVDKLDISALNLRNVHISHDVWGTLFEGDTTGGQAFYLRSTADINAPDVLGLTAGVLIQGNMGSDTLIGSAFGDIIGGFAGTDRIIGGGGADVMAGRGIGLVYVSPDVNTFVYLAASDSTAAATDRIRDFQTGQDKIDLTAVHTAAGDTVNFLSDATTTHLFVQHAGETTADMVILLETPTFAMTDILW